MTQMYNDPVGGTDSDIGTQIRTDKYIKMALYESRKEQYFMPLANVKTQPKHMGKKMKRYHYLPLLDDRNTNDQGIDAAGVTIVQGTWDAFNAAGARVTGGVGANGDGSYPTEGEARTAAGAGGTAIINGGNLYGSSKDIGAISGKLPTLSETGGRVNRVGFKRIDIEGSLEKFGFFDEYSQESMDFDTDAEKQMHISREMLTGAVQMTEAALQVDLLNSAGIVRYPGSATSNATIDATSTVTYGDLLRLSIDLDNSRTPKTTKAFNGTRMVDTRTISGGRVMYIGSELLPTLEAMVDAHGDPALVKVHKYASGSSVLEGEVGSVGYFRIVVVPEMLNWSAAGGDASGTATHYETADKYNVYPMLVIGDASFSTIGFQTHAGKGKFTIYHKAPGEAVADKTNPFGEEGFMSIKWFYGFMLERSERIGLIKTSALI